MVQRMGTLPSKNIEVMKTAANQAWEAMDKDYIIKVCEDFVPRLMRIIAADRGPIEY